MNTLTMQARCRMLIATLILSLGASLPAWTADQAAAPDFTLTDVDGRPVTLSDLRGRVVMINFWASWCGPCRQEMPLLEQIHQRYEPLGFTLLGINVEENSADGQAFIAERPVSFPVLYDPDNGISKLYDVVAMPSTVLIDRQGNVRYLHHGYKPGYEDEYQDQVRALARERS